MKRAFILSALTILIFLSVLLSLFIKKGASEEKVLSTSQSQISQQSPLVAEFYRRAQKDLTSDGVGLSTQQYVSMLSSDKQAEIARAITGNPDERFALFGISLLIKLGHEDEAVPAVAEMVVRGNDNAIPS